jgi:hypothetical protein
MARHRLCCQARNAEEHSVYLDQAGLGSRDAELPGYRGRMICWDDADELDRLGRLRQTKHGWWDPPLPAELTTPKVRATPA